MVLQRIRVVVADDHPIVRDGITIMLDAYAHIEVVATVANFVELFQLVPTTHVDVLILDIGGMGSSPLTVLERLKREQPELAIVVFSSSIDLVPEMLQAGAKGYVAKEELSDQLVGAIQNVQANQTFLSPIAQDYLARCNVHASQQRLTPQELSVLKLLAQGLGTSAIADHLSIDPRTVHNYILKLKTKTGCDQRTQLVSWYRRVYEVPDA